MCAKNTQYPAKDCVQKTHDDFEAGHPMACTYSKSNEIDLRHTTEKSNTVHRQTDRCMDTLYLYRSFSAKKALQLVAVLQEMTYYLRIPMYLRHPVDGCMDTDDQNCLCFQHTHTHTNTHTHTHTNTHTHTHTHKKHGTKRPHWMSVYVYVYVCVCECG